MKSMQDIRHDFPIFQQKVHGYPFIYFDSAATSQVPDVVIDAIASYYEGYKANVGRGIYQFAEVATERYEQARADIAQFFGAQSSELIFTTGTTQAINLFAYAWAWHHLKAGDEILVSEVEHHANFIIWQHLAAQKGCMLRIVPVNEQGCIDLEILQGMLSLQVRLVAVQYVSNMLGTVHDIQAIAGMVHSVGAKLFVDAAQAAGHISIDVHTLGIDAMAVSAHKMFGPTGVGALYVDKAMMNDMKPFIFGGGIVHTVSYDDTELLAAPFCFEPGTQPIAQVIGFGAAVRYIQDTVDRQKQMAHETMLAKQMIAGLQVYDSVKIVSHIPQAHEHGFLVTWTTNKLHPHDVAAYLDQFGIAVRAGHHCVQPYHTKLQLPATVRMSFSVYNTADEVSFCLDKLQAIL